MDWLTAVTRWEQARTAEKDGAPGEIRTPDLMLRRTYPTKNQQLTRKTMNESEVLWIAILGGKTAAKVAIHRSQSGLPVGTKMGTIFHSKIR
jgi:hypothetical protein